MITDEAIWAGVQAMQPDRIQGFHYGNEFVIRDVWRLPDEQELWRGPDTDREPFDRQIGVERFKLALVAIARFIEPERRPLNDSQVLELVVGPAGLEPATRPL